MQAKEYTIREFKIGNFQDQNGNTWCDMVLEENPSEPVRIVVKDPTKFSNGQKIYGKIKQMTSQQGKQYYRFYREQKQDAQSGGTTYDSNGAKHGNALKIAADFYLARGVQDMNEDQFVDAVQSLAAQIFGIQVPEQAVGSTETKQQTTGTTQPQQNVSSTFGKDVVVEDIPDEYNLSDIPF